jgi:hypothetical protein
MDKKPATVGLKEQLGFGVIAIAIFLFALPSAAQKIADLGLSTPYAILAGSVLVVSIFTLLAGIAITVAKFEGKDEE